VFDLETTNRGTGLPAGQAVVPGTGAEYFRVDTADGRYDEVEIGVPFPLQLADAGVQLAVPYVNAAHDTAAQKLTGSAEDGSTVTIYDKGAQVGTTSADASTGAWSFPIGVLADGSTHSYTVTATDAAGNVSQASQALNFTVDTTPPATPATPTDSAVVNGYVTVYTLSLPPTGDLTLTGTITTDGNLGALTLPDFLDWDLTVYSASLSAGFEFLGPAHGPTSNSTLDLRYDNIFATNISLFLPYPGVFDLESIPHGVGQAVVTPSPPGGNVEYFRVETTLGYDEVEIGLPTSGVQLADAGVQLAVPRFVNAAHDTANQALTGTAENASTVTIYDNGNFVGTTTADASTGAWSFPIGALADGSTHRYTVTATDAAGNVSQPSAALSFVVDTTPPATPAAPTDNAVVNSYVNAANDTANQTLTGTAENGSTLTVYDNGTQVGTTAADDSTGVWSFAIGKLADASTHSYTVTAADAAGNVSQASQALNFTVDTTPPATPATPADSSVVNGYVNAAHDTAAQALTGSAEDGSTVAIYDNNTQVGTTTADASTGAWSFPIGALADGSTHRYTVTATDAAGNVSQPSTGLSFAVDTTIPALIAVAEGPSTADLNAGKTVTITVTTSEAVIVTGTPTLTLSDNGTATYSSNLPNGATIQDGGGNNLNLSLSAVPTYSGPQIDTSTPTVSSIIANPSTGTVFTGQVITITVDFSEKVSVTGTPTLSLNDGGTATYQSGSGTNALVFSYSVLTGQYTSNLAVTGFNLPNGATVKDGGGNIANLSGATVTFNGLQVSGSVADNRISSSSGNWTTVGDWSSGVPNSNSDALISKTGSYTITISSADIAHSLSLNDTGAVVSDNTGGSLKLAGGSGTLTITNGTFQLNVGSLQAGTISILSGGTFLVAQGTYTGTQAITETITDNGSLTINTTATITGNISGTGQILAENKANLTVAGNLTGSETFTTANSAHSLISTAVSGTGSFVIANSGVLEFGAADSENVTFASGSSGMLQLDHSLTTPFTGSISGLTPKNSIDLADLAWVKGHMTCVVHVDLPSLLAEKTRVALSTLKRGGIGGAFATMQFTELEKEGGGW
jgi:large repetitive protein